MNKHIDVVKFAPETDGVTAVYVDGSHYVSGDYYHDKIDEWTDGFLAGLRFAQTEFSEARWEVPADKCESVYQMGEGAPAKWPDTRKRFFRHAIRVDTTPPVAEAATDVRTK